jgi:hypothetical protein
MTLIAAGVRGPQGAIARIVDDEVSVGLELGMVSSSDGVRCPSGTIDLVVHHEVAV